MLNHTYTSVKNANLVDCGKKQHIPSQPSPLLKDNFLGEFRTELDKKKVLANLGILTDLLLEWEYIKGDIGKSESLIKELDSRTKYISEIDGFQKTIIEGIKYLETVVGGEEKGEKEQNDRLTFLETETTELAESLEILKDYLQNTIEVDIDKLKEDLSTITEKVNNITNLIQVSAKEGNALILEEGDAPGLYVPDLSLEVNTAAENIKSLRTDVNSILDSYVTKEELGGGDFDFVDQDDFDNYVDKTDDAISDIKSDLKNTVKTGEDGHVDTLYVNTVSKNNDSGNIKITDSFEVTEGIPLDVRFVVESLDELLALPVKVCYSGMGVIVNSLSSLYILRKPSDGTVLTQEYVSNVYNWKCPEDLVTVALSRSDYESLAEINPNVFYYIYEEEFKLTHKPRLEEYTSQEDYEKALQDWNAQIKILDQQYLAASWGIEIEDKLSKKANQLSINILNDSINDLQEQINLLSGGDSDTSLSNLAGRLADTEASLEFLLGTEGTDEEPSTEGKIVEIESSISALDKKVTEEYVSVESITTENNSSNYIFVKKSDYESDKINHESSISNEISTKSVITERVALPNIIITSNESDLLVNNKEVALVEEVPLIIYLTQEEYDNLLPEEIDSKAYYYTTGEEIYVTKTEFDTKVSQINTSFGTLNTSITNQSDSIDTLQRQIIELLDTVQTLESRIADLETSNT